MTLPKAVSATILLAALPACSPATCGEGTTEVDGTCVAISNPTPGTPASGVPTGTVTGTPTGAPTTGTGTPTGTTTTGACATAVDCINSFTVEFDDGATYAEALECRTISGDLTFYATTFLTDVELPCLEEIGGDLLMSAGGIHSISAPRLSSVGGAIDLSGVGLETLSLPALTTTPSFKLSSTWGLTTLDIASLAAADTVEIRTSHSLKDLSGFDRSQLDVSYQIIVQTNDCLPEAEVDDFIDQTLAAGAAGSVNAGNGGLAPCP